MESLLIITGSMGSGKTSVLGEASDLLAKHHIIHAAIDSDALGLAHIESGETRTVMHRNLQCVCENYAALGVTRLLMARAIEDRAELELCRTVVSATSTVVCRLTASIETMERRIRMRESGVAQQAYITRVAELNAILDHARLEDFVVSSENRSVTEVAEEVLIKARWISK
jgi:adenylylsulfate kinase-like enzyme